MTIRKRKIVCGYIMLTPVMLYFCLFVFYPIIRAFWLSFYEYNLFAKQAEFVGLENYLNMMKDHTVMISMRNTFYFAFFTISFGVIISFLLALAFNKVTILSRSYRTIYFIPVLAPLVAASLVWFWLYEPRIGLVNYFLSFIGFPPQKWLSNIRLAMPSIIIMSVWKNLGFYTLILFAGLKSIPKRYYEAAKIDGVSDWQCTVFITLPLLKPVILFVIIINSIRAFQAFSQIYVMTRGGPVDTTRTMVYSIYETAFKFFRMGYASSMAILLFAVILGLTILQMRVQKFS